jgi:hypothetical protein
MQETKETEETETQATEKPAKGFYHTVRHKDGGTVTIKNYTISKAIKLNCSECCGFDDDPRKCPDKLCPLFPFKDYTMLNRTRANFERNMTPEHKEKMQDALKKYREQKAAAKSNI